MFEAVRQYQATLEAHRAAYPQANAEEAEEMDAELARARKTLEVAWLNAAVPLTSAHY